jgi:group II intron reverse transcriptase/maturase
MTTGGRKPKKQKLRNAEYYDFQSVQDMLYAKSKRNAVFKDLMQYVLSEENIMLAYRNIKKNNGSRTAGVDKKTIQNLSNLSAEKLIATVQNKLRHYQPQAVRRVEIPKPNDPSKKRPLGIPTIMDRLIQQCFLQVLEPICEAKFHENSHGFRPNRSQEHALAQCDRMMQISHLHFVVDVDIKGFFDNVNHGKLLKQMWAMGIRDKTVISIISAMLKAEVAGIGFPLKGTPQGGIISPLLSNIVLNELDWWIDSQWESMPTQHDYLGQPTPNGGISYSNRHRALRKTKLKECQIVRYADDFKIFCRDRKSAEKLFVAVRLWLKDRLGLDISPEKSKVVNLKQRYSEFLGFKLKVTARKKKKQNTIKYVVKSHVSEKALKRIREKTADYIYNIQHPKCGSNQYQAVSRFNAYLIGIHNYYGKATMVSADFKKIAYSVHKSLKARLKSAVKSKKEVQKRGLPHSISPFVQKKYGESAQLKFISGNVLIPIGYVHYDAPMHQKRTVNSYTPEGREEIHKILQGLNIGILQYLMRNPVIDATIEYNDNRLALFCAQMGKCAVTGEALVIGDIHCHHITPRYLVGKDNYQNLTLVTETVHRLIHAKNPDTVRNLEEKLRLTSKQKKKLDKLRKLANVDICLDERQDCN